MRVRCHFLRESALLLAVLLLAGTACRPVRDPAAGEEVRNYEDLVTLSRHYFTNGQMRQYQQIRESFQTHWDDLSDRQKSRFLTVALEESLAAGDSALLAQQAETYRTLAPASEADWLLLSRVDESLGKPDLTLEALDRVRRRRLPLEDQIAYLRRLFRAETALDLTARQQHTYRQYVRTSARKAVLDRTPGAQDAADEAQIRRERFLRGRWRVLWVAVILTLAAASAAGYRGIRRRSRREWEQQARQVETLQQEAARARGEAEQWKLLLQKEQVPPEVKTLVSGRIEALNRYALQKLSRQDTRAAASLEQSLSHADREQFVRDLRLQFRYLHPDLTAFLEAQGLTEQEMTCCTLLLLGCQTKEISTQTGLSVQRCYNIFNTVRRKLGLREDRRTLYTILSERIRAEE